LSTGDQYSPGNFGLWDQHRALEFVKENIKNFRGDPNWITLVGHSTGAASVGLHLLSPRSHSKCYSLVYTNLFSFDCKTSYSVYVDHTLSSS